MLRKTHYIWKVWDQNLLREPWPGRQFTLQRIKSYMFYEGRLRKEKQLKQKILFLNLDVKERRDMVWKLGREQGNLKDWQQRRYPECKFL